MNEQERQLAKEQAVLLALQNDMALIRRDLEIYGMKKDGSTEFISKSEDYDNLWADALKALKEKFPDSYEPKNNIVCIKCGKEMVIKSQDTSHNSKTGQEYDRTIYCAKQMMFGLRLKLLKNSLNR